MPQRDITVIGETNFRNRQKRFGIRRADRRHHMYIIGKTGTGKSTLIANIGRQDITNGEGLAVIDPHGDLVEKLVAAVPEERRGDLIYFNVPDTAHPLAFNPLEPTASRHLVVSGVISVLKHIWADSWGPRMEYILRNTLVSLMELPSATLLDVPRVLTSPDFRRLIVARVHSPEVRNFWANEYEKYSANFRTEAIAPIQNKIGEFLVNPIIRRIVGHAKSSFDLRKVMDGGKVLLVNLAKGRIGEDTAALLGSMLVTKLGLAALSRADVTEEHRRDFYLYVDEFPSFTTDSFAGMLSEMRKYRLCLTLAHQHLSQLEDQIRDAILGNVGTLVAFRLGLVDAEVFEKEVWPQFEANDLVGLPNHHMYVKLMIDGKAGRPFSAESVMY